MFTTTQAIRQIPNILEGFPPGSQVKGHQFDAASFEGTISSNGLWVEAPEGVLIHHSTIVSVIGQIAVGHQRSVGITYLPA